MRLSMYLGDQLVAEVSLGLVGRPITHFSLQREMEELLQKHKAAIETSPHKPTFYLENVPSQVGTFVSLMEKVSVAEFVLQHREVDSSTHDATHVP